MILMSRVHRDPPKQNKADDAQDGPWTGLIEDFLPDAEPSAQFTTSLKQRLDVKRDVAVSSAVTPSVSRLDQLRVHRTRRRFKKREYWDFWRRRRHWL